MDCIPEIGTTALRPEKELVQSTMPGSAKGIKATPLPAVIAAGVANIVHGEAVLLRVVVPIGILEEMTARR